MTLRVLQRQVSPAFVFFFALTAAAFAETPARHSVRCSGSVAFGQKRTLREYPKSIAFDPKQPIAAKLRCNATRSANSYLDL
jgi:hypothetical protein